MIDENTIEVGDLIISPNSPFQNILYVRKIEYHNLDYRYKITLYNPKIKTDSCESFFNLIFEHSRFRQCNLIKRKHYS